MVYSNYSTVRSKFSSDPSYVYSFVQRSSYLNNYSASIIGDISLLINQKGIDSGVMPVGNVTYSDAPEYWNNYGLIVYNKHYDAYVSVIVYGEGASPLVSFRRFNLNSGVWMQDRWMSIHMDGMTSVSAKKFVADESDMAISGGYMFNEDSYDTGMGSDGNGQLYFAKNGVKYRFDDILKTYRYSPSEGPINLNNLVEPGVHTFTGSVQVTNGPSGITVMGDASMFVTGKSHGFKLLSHQYQGLWYQNIAFDGTTTAWVRIV